MQLNKEQLQFFMNEVLGLLNWTDEEENAGIDPLWFVQQEVKLLRKQLNECRTKLREVTK